MIPPLEHSNQRSHNPARTTLARNPGSGCAKPGQRRTHVSFPIIDTQGRLITAERRNQDRRQTRAHRHQTHTTDAASININSNSNRRRTLDRRARRTQVMQNETGPLVPKILIDTGEAFLELKCNGEALTLGRSIKCDLVAPFSYVSHLHARILCEEGHFILQDSSANATFVLTHEGTERALHQTRMALQGSGIIRLGTAIGDEPEILVRYNIINTI